MKTLLSRFKLFPNLKLKFMLGFQFVTICSFTLFWWAVNRLEKWNKVCFNNFFKLVFLFAGLPSHMDVQKELK